jgi:TIR domain
VSEDKIKDWTEIQRELRYKLGELFYSEQSIRAIVRDVDAALIKFIRWDGNAVDCWSGILDKIRILHFELKLMKAVREEYQQDEALQKAENDIKVLLATKPPEPPQTVVIGPINVFIIYAEEDEKFKQELEKFLKPLIRQKIIHSMHSESIVPGDSRQENIAKLINTAQIVLLLVSQNFLNSDQIYDHEMMYAMERHNLKVARVIPIILRSTDLTGIPFEGLQALPRHGKVIGTPGNDEAWNNVGREIRQICEQLRANKGN